MDFLNVLRLEVEDPNPGLVNLIDNPDGALGGWGYFVNYPGAVLSGEQTYPWMGAGVTPGPALAYRTVSGGNAFYSEPVPVAAGRWVKGTFVFGYATAAGYGVRARIEWLDATLTHFASSSYTGYFTQGATRRTIGAVQAPAGTAYAMLRIELYADTSGTNLTTDGALFYFQGITLASASTEAALAGVTTLPPTKYVNVLGPTHSIRIERAELNLGMMTAVVVDSALDPATAPELRPGRRVRVMALDATLGAWAPLYTGRLTRGESSYDLKRGKTKITVSAVDPMQRLASTPQAQSVATVAELAHLLEGAGVPWNLNGSGAQIGSATIVARNDNATLADQIALTRDTVLGRAWLDRTGVLQVHDRNRVPASIPRGQASLTGAEQGAKRWSSYQSDGNSISVFFDTAVYRSAPESARLRTPTSGTSVRYMGAQLRDVTVVPGRRYRISGWIRSAATSRPVGVHAEGIGTGHIIHATASTVVGQWVEVSGEFTIPAGVTRTDFGVGVYRERTLSTVRMPAGEEHYVDDLLLTPVLDEADYSDLTVGFDTGDIINSVTVTVRRPGENGQTTDEKFGPYEDAASIQAWGRYHKDFTTTEQIFPPTYAATVLAANAQPAVRVSAMKLPITNAGRILPELALLDLYGRVQLVNSTRGLDHAAYPTSIAHTITADARHGGRWLVDVGFGDTAAVAAPATAPALSVPEDAEEVVPEFAGDVGPIAEGVTATRRGDLVDLQWSLVMSATKAPGSTLLLLPPGFKPRRRHRITMSFPAAGAAGVVNGYLDPSGALVTYGGIGTGQDVHGCLTYTATPA